MFPCQKHGCPGHRSVMLAHNCIEVGNCSRVHNERSWIKAGNQQQITFHYAKPTQLPRAKSGPPYRRQVVHPRPPTPQGRSGAEPGAPLPIILRLVCICDMHAHLNVNTRHTLLHFDIERPRKKRAIISYDQHNVCHCAAYRHSSVQIPFNVLCMI